MIPSAIDLKVSPVMKTNPLVLALQQIRDIPFVTPEAHKIAGEAISNLPWTVEAVGRLNLLQTPGVRMADIAPFAAASDLPDGEYLLYAHAPPAITAAAPDLLAALQGVLRVADRKTDEFDAAHAAIAKATGKETVK